MQCRRAFRVTITSFSSYCLCRMRACTRGCARFYTFFVACLFVCYSPFYWRVSEWNVNLLDLCERQELVHGFRFGIPEEITVCSFSGLFPSFRNDIAVCKLQNAAIAARRTIIEFRIKWSISAFRVVAFMTTAINIINVEFMANLNNKCDRIYKNTRTPHSISISKWCRVWNALVKNGWIRFERRSGSTKNGSSTVKWCEQMGCCAAAWRGRGTKKKQLNGSKVH